MARERPRAPIIGMTPRLATARRLALVWGVHAVLCHEVVDVPEMSELRQPHGREGRLRRAPARPSSSPPACHSARPAPPTSCASRRSERAFTMAQRSNRFAASRCSTHAAIPPWRPRCVLSDGAQGFAASPSGASTGAREAIELRDGDPEALLRQGRDARRSATSTANCARHWSAAPPMTRPRIDRLMIDLDGTPTKARLGRQRDPGRLARAGQGGGGVERPAALSAHRRRSRARAADAHDEHHQRRRPCRQQRRHAGVHDRAGGCADASPKPCAGASRSSTR